MHVEEGLRSHWMRLYTLQSTSNERLKKLTRQTDPVQSACVQSNFILVLKYNFQWQKQSFADPLQNKYS